MRGPHLAYSVSTCRHCGEPILRPVTVRMDADVLLRWLHTPVRAECIDPLTREPTGTVAEPKWAVIAA